MAWRRGEPASAQSDPALLTEDDWWTWSCGLCGMCTQGGRGGLDTHMATVHADEQHRKPFGGRAS